MASIQATRLKKGMLIKQENDLFRVLELQHVTPGNLRGFVRCKLRNIRSGSLSILISMPFRRRVAGKDAMFVWWRTLRS